MCVSEVSVCTVPFKRSSTSTPKADTFTFFISRFGSFEIFKPVDRMTGRGGLSVGRKDILEQMLEYVIKTFFPEVSQQTHVVSWITDDSVSQ